MSCGCNGLGRNGLGAYFKDSVTRAGRAARAGRVVGMDVRGRAIATDGMGAYYLAVPGQMFSGFGAAQTFAFDSAAVWSDWVASKCADPKDYQNNQAMCTIRGKRAVNSIRAALGELGYGTSVMSVSWGPEDQANYKQWAADSGQVSSSGMPEKGHLQLMEQQISQGMKPGPEAAVSFVKVGDEIVQKGAAVLAAAKGLGWKVWALIGVAALGAGYLIYKKKKSKQYTSYKKTTAIEPYRGGGQMQPAYAANRRRRHRKTRRNGRKY